MFLHLFRCPVCQEELEEELETSSPPMMFHTCYPQEFEEDEETKTIRGVEGPIKLTAVTWISTEDLTLAV